jgi:hypothetical protein
MWAVVLAAALLSVSGAGTDHCVDTINLIALHQAACLCAH